jgi:hypothetical protein
MVERTYLKITFIHTLSGLFLCFLFASSRLLYVISNNCKEMNALSHISVQHRQTHAPVLCNMEYNRITISSGLQHRSRWRREFLEAIMKGNAISVCCSLCAGTDVLRVRGCWRIGLRNMSDKEAIGNEGRKMTSPSHGLMIFSFLLFQGSCVWRSVMWILTYLLLCWRPNETIFNERCVCCTEDWTNDKNIQKRTNAKMSALWRRWFAHCTTSRNAAGSILDQVIGIFH